MTEPRLVTLIISDSSFNIDYADKYGNIKVVNSGDIIITAEADTVKKVTNWLLGVIKEKEAEA